MEWRRDSSRRDFMAWGLWGILGVIGASLAWPVVELATRRTGGGKRLVYYPAVDLAELPESGVKKVEMTLRGGSLPDTRVFIRQEPGGRLTAFSAICTHLGCLVNFNRIKSEFLCPCHGGRYDMDGKVVAGPPPAPLARLPLKVEHGRVMVGFMV
jgi:cytochrome b6-f complex iron-sulfur subunit